MQISLSTLIVVNNHRCQVTLACLASLTQSTYGQVQNIILDNRTSDGSLPAIRSAFSIVQIIALTENLGYTGNNSVSIRAALARGAEWVFLLNDDPIIDPTCLVQPPSLKERSTSQERRA